MNYKDIDYTKYLSYDNGKGILLSSTDIEILERYDIDFRGYASIKDLIIDLENLCDVYDIDDDLEDLLNKLSEVYYYNYVKK